MLTASRKRRSPGTRLGKGGTQYWSIPTVQWDCVALATRDGTLIVWPSALKCDNRTNFVAVGSILFRIGPRRVDSIDIDMQYDGRAQFGFRVGT